MMKKDKQKKHIADALAEQRINNEKLNMHTRLLRVMRNGRSRR